MRIHLRAQNWSSLGDDTFWCWAAREWPDTVVGGRHDVLEDDWVLHYGLLGAPEVVPERTVALLWEQHPEMQREVSTLCPGGGWQKQIMLLHKAAAACARRTVASEVLVDDYKQYGKIDVLPLGVDTDLWKPTSDGWYKAMRQKYHIPENARVGFWGGTKHPMKGWDSLQQYAKAHPNVWWVVVFKQKRDQVAHDLKGVTRVGILQEEVATLMQICDFALFTSRLRPYAMLEWEAMSCNLPVINVGHPRREFEPGPDPRRTVFDRGWDRHTAKKTWLEYLEAA